MAADVQLRVPESSADLFQTCTSDTRNWKPCFVDAWEVDMWTRGDAAPQNDVGFGV